MWAATAGDYRILSAYVNVARVGIFGRFVSRQNPKVAVLINDFRHLSDRTNCRDPTPRMIGCYDALYVMETCRTQGGITR